MAWNISVSAIYCSGIYIFSFIIIWSSSGKLYDAGQWPPKFNYLTFRCYNSNSLINIDLWITSCLPSHNVNEAFPKALFWIRSSRGSLFIAIISFKTFSVHNICIYSSREFLLVIAIGVATPLSLMLSKSNTIMLMIAWIIGYLQNAWWGQWERHMSYIVEVCHILTRCHWRYQVWYAWYALFFQCTIIHLEPYPIVKYGPTIFLTSSYVLWHFNI